MCSFDRISIIPGVAKSAAHEMQSRWALPHFPPRTYRSEPNNPSKYVQALLLHSTTICAADQWVLRTSDFGEDWDFTSSSSKHLSWSAMLFVFAFASAVWVLWGFSVLLLSICPHNHQIALVREQLQWQQQ